MFDEVNVLLDAEEDAVAEDEEDKLSSDDENENDIDLDDEKKFKISKDKIVRDNIKKSDVPCPAGQHKVFRNLGSKKVIRGGKNKGKALPEWAIVCAHNKK